MPDPSRSGNDGLQRCNAATVQVRSSRLRYNHGVTPSGRRPAPITVLDLFAGCGGFTQGFHSFRPVNAPDRPVFQSVGAVEWDRAAAATYAANFGESGAHPDLTATKVHLKDIEQWEPSEAELNVEVVVGGPPCQGFSALNRNKVKPERNRLWEEFVRVVERVQPKVFVIENVDRFVRSPEFQDLNNRMRPGAALENYGLIEAPGVKPGDTPQDKARKYLLNAADFGAAQARRRAIVVGVRKDDEGRFVAPVAYPAAGYSREALVHSADLDGMFTVEGVPKAWRTVREIFERTAGLDLVGTELPARSSRLSEISGSVAGIYRTTDLHVTRNPEPLSRARYRAIGREENRLALKDKYFHIDRRGRIHILRIENGQYRDVETDRLYDTRRGTPKYLSTESWDRHSTGSGDVMGRLRMDYPSVTIRTEFFKPEKGRYLHPTDDRPITHYEAAAIQGFPEDFKWCGSKVEIARQIGNAVPIPLGRAIAGAIFEALRPVAGEPI